MPGPAANQYADENACEGVVLHSAEGHFSAGNTPIGLMVSRDVSWHFTVFEDGRVQQHFPLSASCWHSGGLHGENRRLIGVEHEGVGTPLTAPQLASSLVLVRWLAEVCGWGPLARRVNLWEHNEISSTTCPNGRIPWERYLAPYPLPQGEFLPEPDESDAAAFYRAAMLGPQPDSEIIAIPPEREGWAYWKFGVKR
jgi:N-acetyl-anhydromuramyl-L-alanine amidase AmpD